MNIYDYFNGTHIIRIRKDEEGKLKVQCAAADSDGIPITPFESPKASSWYKDKSEMLEEVLVHVLGDLL